MEYLVDLECKKPSRAYLVKLFIENGSNPNMMSEGVKHAPIHWLCFWGDWRATTILLRMNNLHRIVLKTPGLLDFNKKPTYNSFLEEHGAFNML